MIAEAVSLKTAFYIAVLITFCVLLLLLFALILALGYLLYWLIKFKVVSIFISTIVYLAKHFLTEAALAKLTSALNRVKDSRKKRLAKPPVIKPTQS